MGRPEMYGTPSKKRPMSREPGDAMDEGYWPGKAVDDICFDQRTSGVCRMTTEGGVFEYDIELGWNMEKGREENDQLEPRPPTTINKEENRTSEGAVRTKWPGEQVCGNEDGAAT